MSRNDCTEILKFIRFDKKNHRSQHLQSDKFALILIAWDRFIQNSPTNKSGKFGIKFWLTKYISSKLLSKRTTLVGTIRGNKKELSTICKTKKNTMARFSSFHYKLKKIILTIYKTKPKKIFVLNSKHKSVGIEKNKFGIDIADQMLKSVKSESKRSSLQLKRYPTKKILFQLADELTVENVAENVKLEMESREVNVTSKSSLCLRITLSNKFNVLSDESESEMETEIEIDA
ncbi:piggyBac transposable element-derived protein 4-like [Vespula squamosa]|uniref:PiggyBac transposable element-derived protein 4-like n=1 Tax=Vespula squamosa TaxID=30214 RepID=A0ABD2AF57_VESSQ